MTGRLRIRRHQVCQAFFGRAMMLAVLTLTVAMSAAPIHADATQVVVIESHEPIGADEYPRLIVRGADGVKRLRSAPKTEWNQGVRARLNQSLKLMAKASLIGRNREVIKEAGFRAAGHASVYVMSGDKAEAAKAADTVSSQIVKYPMKGRLETMDRASRLHGAAIAYDLANQAWGAETRAVVGEFLLAESKELVEKVGGVEIFKPGSEVPIAVIASAGLAELAVLSGPEDKQAIARIQSYEKAVLRFLNEGISEQGFAVGGESVRQAALASGVVPFAIALKNVLGRDMTGHPAIAQALRPMVYQTVPEAGLPITGSMTAQVDRTGLFVMALPLADEADRPGIKWMFDHIGGNRYFGVVRPHHALYALISGMGEVEAAAPTTDRWPLVIDEPKAGVVLMRTGWAGADDLVVMLHQGSLRIIGKGARWASTAGRHATYYSGSTGAGRIDNRFFVNQDIVRKNRVYRAEASHQIASVAHDPESQTLTVRYTMEGSVKRTKKTYRVKKKVNGKNRRVEKTVPEGGAFKGTRVVGLDYSGKSGALVVLAFADRIEGADAVMRSLTQHVGFGNRPGASGKTFSLKQGGTVMQRHIISGGDIKWQAQSNPPHWNFVHADVTGDALDTVLLLGGGQLPEVKASGQTLADGVTVGSRSVRLDGDAIVFGDAR